MLVKLLIDIFLGEIMNQSVTQDILENSARIVFKIKLAKFTKSPGQTYVSLVKARLYKFHQ